MRSRGEPPALLERLLRLCLPSGIVGESIAGDLRQEYVAWRKREGRFQATLRYVLHALPIALRYSGARLRQLLAGSNDRKRKGGRMSPWIQDIRYALRILVKNPAFALVAVVTLALGMGATTAIFSVADKALLQKLPVQDPEELVKVYTTCRAGDPRCSSSYPDFLDYRERSGSFEDMAAYSWLPGSLGDEGQPARQTVVMIATGNYFQVLGLTPHRGRLLQPRDDVKGAPAQVAVLTHDFWKRGFGGDESIVGREVRLNGLPFTVVGVAPPGFRGIDLGSDTDLWVPMFSASLLNFGSVSATGIFESRGSRWIASLVGRLGEDATLEQARQEMLAISEQLREEHPDARGPRSVTLDRASGYSLPTFSRDDFVRFVLLLLAAVGLTLLLACANLANLLLARASARMRETGIRLCLGAKRSQLVRQLLTESLLLALMGSLAGLAVAIGLLQALGSFRLPGNILIGDLGITLDWRVFLFALGLALVTGVAFGLIPALQSVRLDPVSAVRSDRSSLSHSSPRLRKALLSVQVGVCLVLLVGAGLFAATLRNALSVDLGFPSDGLALSRFNLALLRYTPERAEIFVRRLLERVEALPRVESAAVATRVPLQIGGATATFAKIEGYQPPPGERIRVEYLRVTPGYFKTLGLPLLQGRDFSGRDREGSELVTVINEAMARRFFQGSPLGKTITLGGKPLRVVGVAENTSWRGFADEQANFAYVPLPQTPSAASDSFLTLMARTPGDARSLLPDLRAEFRALDPQLALTSERTMRGQMRLILMPQRMGAFLLGALGALSLLLALVGVYGIVSFIVSQRRRDIGVHMAMGATRGEVLRMTLASILYPIAFGLVAGLMAALTLSASAQAFVFQVSPHDPKILASAALLLLAAAALSAFFPAQRASRLDPITVLRAE